MLELGLLDQFATATIETAMNALIKDKPEQAKRLHRLKGQVLQIHIIELDKTLTFLFSQQVDVLAQYEGKPDCFLSLHLSVLPELRDQNNITRLIKQEKIELEGELQLAQQFSQLLIEIRPDLEEWLSRVTGDVVAHTLVRGMQESGRWLSQRLVQQQSHLSQIITEEWRLAPGPLEVAYFCDQVSDSKKAADDLLTRINALLERS